MKIVLVFLVVCFILLSFQRLPKKVYGISLREDFDEIVQYLEESTGVRPQLITTTYGGSTKATFDINESERVILYKARKKIYAIDYTNRIDEHLFPAEISFKSKNIAKYGLPDYINLIFNLFASYDDELKFSYSENGTIFSIGAESRLGRKISVTKSLHNNGIASGER